MRIQLASALCVALLSTCSPPPAAAQSNPANTKPIQSFFAKPLADAALSARWSAGPQNAEQAAAGLASDLRDAMHRATKPFLDIQQEKSATEPSPCGQCAHMLIFRAPSMDEKMIIELPQDYSSPMPMYRGLLPCPQDFRGSLMTPPALLKALPPATMLLFPGPRFIRPLQRSPLLLDPRKPFHPDHP